MASSDHGGNGTRDCRYDDPELDSSATGNGKLWEQTIGAGALKGDVSNSTSNSPDGLSHRAMWRWQSVGEFVFPEVARMAASFQNPVMFAGVETNVPGHEHTSMSVIGAQRAYNFFADIGNADSLAEFEFRFDRSDTDTSGKGGTPGVANSGIWKGKVANASGSGSGTANHLNKAVPSVAWMQANFPLNSYYVPAHVERAGVFDPNANRGFNVEHFRDFNNVGPTVAVGFETMPGHQASNTRGEYRKDFGGVGIDSVGVTTYGGTGIYGAQIGGLWDSLLGEGRNWFFYASSDWHHRGSFSPYVRASTQDFYPGEYQKTYIPRPDFPDLLRPKHLVSSIRKGNAFAVSGDLITGDLKFSATINGNPVKEARMGETLVVPRGGSVTVSLTVTLPTTQNHSPYNFYNPSLVQLGKLQPLDRPVLDHVDFIRGNVTGVIDKNSPNYTNATNPTAQLYATFSERNWQESGQQRTMTFTLDNVQANQYIRARGTNLLPGTPNETDPQGNPLSDAAISAIPCNDPACPAHMQVDSNNRKLSSFDVAAWSDLWFYTNPIFIRVADSPKLLVETNKELASQLAGTPVGIHDFNGDTKSDITWRDSAGNTVLWLMNGVTVSSTAAVGNLPASWSLIGQRDFDGDGKTDLLWRDTGGNLALWLMNGGTIKASVSLGNVPTNWSVVSTADFDGDGKGDLLWRDTAGNLNLWVMDGNVVTSTASLGNIATNWSVAATADFNGDGRNDILWRDAAGNLVVWTMNGKTATAITSLGNIPTNWSVATTADLNGDGKSDIVWRNTAGDLVLWTMNGAAVSSNVSIGNVPASWAIVGTGDFNGDGKSDLVWRDTAGNVAVWLMNGAAASAVSLGNVPTSWTVQNTNAS
jgi:ketosteroid isomerase-like protein